MDELSGRWLTDESGIFDHDAAEDTWGDCRGAGELARQAGRGRGDRASAG